MALAESPILSSHFSAESHAIQELFSRSRSPKRSHARRDEALDSLIFAAAFASSPHITRNHSGHAIHFPLSHSPERTKRSFDSGAIPDHKPSTYVSKQAPRRLRLQAQEQPLEVVGKENIPQEPPPPSSSDSSAVEPTSVALSREKLSPEPGVRVQCMARTRIPTPHGTVFLHLYHNNHDNKEHLAIVIDPAQYSIDNQSTVPPIRSHSLDAIWSDDETQEDRILRGAYVGRLTPETRVASRPIDQSRRPTDVPPPLVRIHSECFTGETIGSMRCDCGEQLDEAIRIISQPIQVSTSSSATIGRGAVIYLRQEGRGIGLLSKIRAYNLQDVGHDTVTANILLGHKADERGYDIAAAILRDLGLGSEQGEGIRLLTNNPDKVTSLEKEGLRVLERVPMVPRSWKCQSESALSSSVLGSRKAGVTMIGGDMAWGADLNKYLRTKVLRMGHMLPLSMIDGTEPQ
ncbi:GTP cyclohydrolase II-domain-containing protein [Boletus coccyginus]|nr:GTP cyclohydrolase II-domain-containing protein [Boletus coccyginus]